MDFKGITWVGNVYQKFEAMCLEVEEIIVQDTAKYVENQVQTVGNSVKKFCSDVVQDLIPEDSVNSGKPLPVSMLHEYAPVCSFKKKSKTMSGRARDSNQDREKDVSEGKKDGCAMKLRGLDADDYDICTSPRQYSYGGPYRRHRIGRKQKELFQVTTRPCIQNDSSFLSMVHSSRVKDDVGTVRSSDSPPVKVEKLISKEERQKDNRTGNENGLTVVNSVRSRDPEVRTEHQHGPTVVNSDGSQDSETQSSVRSQDTEIRTENEHGLKVVNSVGSQDASVATSLLAGFDDCKEKTNENSMETTSSSSVSEQKSEILQQLSEKSVEESCIIVDRDEAHCVFADKKTEKHKPYKKIRDVISSRMKQNREKEYKRLARQWYAEDVENGRDGDENPKQNEEDQSSEEPEWELL